MILLQRGGFGRRVFLPLAIPGLNKTNGKTPLSAELQSNSRFSIGNGQGKPAQIVLKTYLM
jgi:hypothetical protein